MSIDVLQTKIREKRCPLALALRAEPDDLPPDSRSGSTAADCERYLSSLLDAAAPLVPAVTFDPLGYLALGPEGLAVLGRLVERAGALGLYVLVKPMRSDGAAGAALSAKLWFDGFGADGVCVGAFTGSDGVRPYLPYCKAGKSVFLLARTDGRSAREVQDLLSGDRVVHTVLLDLAVRWGGALVGASGYQGIGAVVSGAPLRALRPRYDRLFFLVPGGCPLKEAQYAFDEFGHGALLETPEDLPAVWRDAADGAADPAGAVHDGLLARKRRLDALVRVRA